MVRKNKIRSIKAFTKSFGYALKGFLFMLKDERNFKVQLFIALIALALGIYFPLQNIEWILLILCIAMVLSAEMINTAMERIINEIHPNYNSKAKAIKDIAAGAVLVLSIASLIIGLIIIIPYFLAILS